MLEIDRRYVLRFAFKLHLLGTLLCIAGVITSLLDVAWPSILILLAGASIFLMNVLGNLSELRAMRLVQPGINRRRGGQTR